MDIKSKNIKYSIFLKSIAVLLIWISFAGLFLPAVFLLKDDPSALFKKSFRETDRYIQEFTRYAHYAVDYGVTLRSEEHIKAGNTVSVVIKEILDGAGPIYVYRQGGNEYTVIGAERAGRDTEKIKQQAIEADLERYRGAKNNLEASANFKYLVINRDIGTFMTNAQMQENPDLEAIKSEFESRYDYLFLSENNVKFSNAAFGKIANDLRSRFEGVPFEVYAAVKTPLVEGDAFYTIEQNFINVHKFLPLLSSLMIISFILGIACLIYLIVTAGYREKGGEVRLAFVDRIYNDVHTMLVLFAAAISIVLGIGSFRTDENIAVIAVFVILSVDLFIGLNYILSMVRHIKNKSLFRRTLIYTAFKSAARLIKLCFDAKFTFAVIAFLFAYGIINSILYVAAVNERGFLRFLAQTMFIGVNVFAVFFVIKALHALTEIMKWVKALSKGDLSYAFGENNVSPAFSAFMLDIKNLQTGFKKAVEEAVRGEKLKTELITNVSHDIKTPLTSIINYVDLIKKENIKNETVNGYIEILEKKSGQLKRLTDDLIEASKAASGAVTVNYEKVDLPSLLTQALAEYSDKMSEAKLDVRVKTAEKVREIRGDGKLMWRIMDNLLSNVVKYAQPNSRVYIDIENAGEYGVITIKNISASALDIPAEQLLERFARGDQSRTTEGSGLGLAIARSLAEIQGGKLNISIDGDLFKASLYIPAQE